MNFVFDPEKDRANRQKHGVSLERAEALDFETAVFVTDDRKDYGERRYQAFGFIGRRLHVLVFTVRGDTLRAISLRKANRKEQNRYDEKA